MKSVKNFNSKTDKVITYLDKHVCIYKHTDSLSHPDIKNAWKSIHNNFLIIPIDTETRNITLVCKRFYLSVIAKELGLNNNSKYNKKKFGISNIPIEYYW